MYIELLNAVFYVFKDNGSRLHRLQLVEADGLLQTTLNTKDLGDVTKINEIIHKDNQTDIDDPTDNATHYKHSNYLMVSRLGPRFSNVRPIDSMLNETFTICNNIKPCNLSWKFHCWNINVCLSEDQT